MNLVRRKIFGFVPCIPIFFKTGLSFLPNRLKAARDCQTSITRQPPGIGPAMCASTPLTGQSASLFLRPFKIILTLFSYLARDVAPGNSKRTPMGMGYLHVSANQRETPTLSAPVDVNQRMSALGQKRTFCDAAAMSALPPCVDGSELARTFLNVCSIGRCSHVFGLFARFP